MTTRIGVDLQNKARDIDSDTISYNTIDLCLRDGAAGVTTRIGLDQHSYNYNTSNLCLREGAAGAATRTALELPNVTCDDVSVFIIDSTINLCFLVRAAVYRTCIDFTFLRFLHLHRTLIQ